MAGKWREVTNDDEFRAILSIGIADVSAELPDELPYNSSDIFWKMKNGQWLGMKVNVHVTCDTCGNEERDKEYWIYEDPPESPLEYADRMTPGGCM